jgi:hypothetical protein
MFRFSAVLGICLVMLQTGWAQNFGSDARRIALGGPNSHDNMASRLVEGRQGYRAIPIPIGLIQVFKKREIFDPNDPNFDPLRAIEYAADPLHLTLNRDSGGAGSRFVRNLVDAELSRDLNTYRGFTPASRINSQGLISPQWGKTFTVADDPAGVSHGIYLGAGPYISLGTDLRFDEQLIGLLAASTDTYLPNTNFLITDTTKGQGAVAITGGYRGRLSPSGFQGTGDGIYLATNYNYLRGIHYDSAALEVRFDTDSDGLVTVAPSTNPIVVNRTTSKSGSGFAIDFAVAVVKGKWDFSVGLDGIGNRINWKDPGGRRYVLQSLSNGGDFVTTEVPLSSSSERVSLPVRYSGSGGYRTDRWSAATELGRGLQGFHFNGGAEYLLGPLAFRGGTRFSRDLWHGATGIGLNITRKFGIDVAAFQTSTNVENDRRISFAASLRINRTSR